MATRHQAQMHSEQLRRRRVQTEEQTETAAEDEEDKEEAHAARTCLSWLPPEHTGVEEGGRKRKKQLFVEWSSAAVAAGLAPLAV